MRSFGIWTLGFAAALTSGQRLQAEVIRPTIIVSDRHFALGYTQDVDSVTFYAKMPTAWSAEVDVDGNQDGKWGYGPNDPSISLQPTDDFSYGDDGPNYNYALCTEYIWSGQPNGQAAPYQFSHCGVFKSGATVAHSAPDSSGYVTLEIRVPAKELFGSNQTAHISIQVWDTKVNTLYCPLSDPYVIHKV
jgi:hypothetical protein